MGLAHRCIDRRVTMRINGHQFFVPAPEERIFAATLQRMYRHFYFRVCDILNAAAIVESGKVDFRELRAAANMAGIWPGVAGFLKIVSDYVQRYRGTGLALPADVVADAHRGRRQDLHARALSAPSHHALWRPALYPANHANGFQRQCSGNVPPQPAAAAGLRGCRGFQNHRQRQRCLVGRTSSSANAERATDGCPSLFLFSSSKSPGKEHSGFNAVWDSRTISNHYGFPGRSRRCAKTTRSCCATHDVTPSGATKTRSAIRSGGGEYRGSLRRRRITRLIVNLRRARRRRRTARLVAHLRLPRRHDWPVQFQRRLAASAGTVNRIGPVIPAGRHIAWP